MRTLKPPSAISRRTLIAGAASGLAASVLNVPAPSAGPMLLQAVPGKPQGPDFTLPDLDGNDVRFADLKGKVVLVNFWATWCPPCRAEIPSMERAWAQLKERNVVMLAVHVGGKPDSIWEFLAEFNVTFPVLIDKSSTASKAWQTIGLPTTYVADRDGRKALRAIGGREWDHPDLIASIVALNE
ncbi:MAG: TlpA family protein disulfide reductase [Hyphomicrobiaceae bacterium]|nr:TlpA family protein disulfide reductase [Hyphomicrobiaceae bacterium]